MPKPVNARETKIRDDDNTATLRIRKLLRRMQCNISDTCTSLGVRRALLGIRGQVYGLLAQLDFLNMELNNRADILQALGDKSWKLFDTTIACTRPPKSLFLRHSVAPVYMELQVLLGVALTHVIQRHDPSYESEFKGWQDNLHMIYMRFCGQKRVWKGDTWIFVTVPVNYSIPHGEYVGHDEKLSISEQKVVSVHDFVFHVEMNVATEHVFSGEDRDIRMLEFLVLGVYRILEIYQIIEPIEPMNNGGFGEHRQGVSSASTSVSSAEKITTIYQDQKETKQDPNGPLKDLAELEQIVKRYAVADAFLGNDVVKHLFDGLNTLVYTLIVKHNSYVAAKLMNNDTDLEDGSSILPLSFGDSVGGYCRFLKEHAIGCDQLFVPDTVRVLYCQLGAFLQAVVGQKVKSKIKIVASQEDKYSYHQTYSVPYNHQTQTGKLIKELSTETVEVDMGVMKSYIKTVESHFESKSKTKETPKPKTDWKKDDVCFVNVNNQYCEGIVVRIIQNLGLRIRVSPTQVVPTQVVLRQANKVMEQMPPPSTSKFGAAWYGENDTLKQERLKREYIAYKKAKLPTVHKQFFAVLKIEANFLTDAFEVNHDKLRVNRDLTKLHELLSRLLEISRIIGVVNFVLPDAVPATVHHDDRAAVHEALADLGRDDTQPRAEPMSKPSGEAKTSCLNANATPFVFNPNPHA